MRRIEADLFYEIIFVNLPNPSDLRSENISVNPASFLVSVRSAVSN